MKFENIQPEVPCRCLRKKKFLHGTWMILLETALKLEPDSYLNVYETYLVSGSRRFDNIFKKRFFFLQPYGKKNDDNTIFNKQELTAISLTPQTGYPLPQLPTETNDRMGHSLPSSSPPEILRSLKKSPSSTFCASIRSRSCASGRKNGPCSFTLLLPCRISPQLLCRRTLPFSYRTTPPLS